MITIHLSNKMALKLAIKMHYKINPVYVYLRKKLQKAFKEL